jgi:hypothetical protein
VGPPSRPPIPPPKTPSPPALITDAIMTSTLAAINEMVT